MFSQQKTIVKKNLGKIGVQQLSGGYSKFGNAKQSGLRQSHGDLLSTSSRRLQQSEKYITDSSNAYAIHSANSKQMANSKPNLGSYGP